MAKSIMQSERECFICHTRLNLEKHHCLHGIANRKKAEADGLWVWLCHAHHTGSNQSVHLNRANDLILIRKAQEAWERKYGKTEDFIKRYGKNYK